MAYNGHIDTISNGVVKGWCINSLDPASKCSVSVSLDGTMLARVDCGLWRDDMARLGFGTPSGHSAYEFELPVEYHDGNAHQIEVRAPDDVQLFGSPMLFLSPSGRGDRSDHAITKLSVVIPTYNRGEIMEASVRQCIALADARYCDFTVVDDGSTDDTKDRLSRMCLEIKNLRGISIRNSGPGAARNAGAQATSGDVVLFIGDDIKPLSQDFFDIHLSFHRSHTQNNIAMLGKTVWPQTGAFAPNFVMARIQGDGQQQFGYKFMMPYRDFPWHFFYTSNVSVKRRLVEDWNTDGFDPDFHQYGFEDAEFALRMTKIHGGFPIKYVPTALAEHLHSHSVASFINRQKSAGVSANLMLQKHPEVYEDLGLSEILGALKSGENLEDASIGHYLSVMKGVQAWACILDDRRLLGTRNWHAEFVDAVFSIAFYEGFVSGYGDPGANYAAVYRFLLQYFQTSVSRMASHEVFGDALSRFELKET